MCQPKTLQTRLGFNVLFCRFFGHKIIEPTAGVELCERCGDSVAYYHDGSQWTDRERYGLVEPIRNWYWIMKRRWLPSIFRRCDQCNKRMWFGSLYDRDFCCKTCHDEWLPF